jgi:glycosyltransferase 2 family protein
VTSPGQDAPRDPAVRPVPPHARSAQPAGDGGPAAAKAVPTAADGGPATAGGGPGAAGGAAGITIDDHLDPRIRLPADALRFVIALIEIALLTGLGLAARATTSGVDIDVTDVSKRFHALLVLLGFLAKAALLILPVILALRLIIRRQFRPLIEAVVTGGIAVGVVAAANVLLRLPAAAPLSAALMHTVSGISHASPLDDLLAGLAAYVTVLGLSGRPRWRAAFWLAVGFYALATLVAGQATVLSLLITVLIGSAIGSGIRYLVGAASERPAAAEIAVAVSTVDAPVTAMRRIWDAESETRRYAATLRGGGQRDVTVFDRDQQAADAFYRIYRRLRVRTQVSRSAPLTLERAMERRALLTYAVEDAGISTPRLHALLRVGPDAGVMVNEHWEGTTLAKLDPPPTDRQLRRVWDTVLRLHKHRVTHRALTADNIMFAGADGNGHGGPGAGGHPAEGDVVLLEPGNGDVAATDLQLRLDLTQLLAALALLVGPERSADIAAERLNGAEMLAMVPLLQPVALHRSTRVELRRHRKVLPALRKRLASAAPAGEVAPVQLERVRPRTLVTLVASVVAAYVLAAELTKTSLSDVLRRADPPWVAAVLILSGVTYLGAAWSLSGFVLERLRLVRTFLAQLAGTFITLVTPAAVGGAALNIRYLRKAGVSAPDAAASVGVSQVFAFGLHILLLVIFIAVTGSSRGHSLSPPEWVYIALVVIAVVVLIGLAIPRGRRLLRSRIAPTLGQVLPRLLDVAQRPMKLTEGIGGALLLTFAYILCLAASVRALGGPVALPAIAVVYLTGNAVGSAVPTPGGVGAVEAALSAGLTAVGVPGATAIGAVLLFRLATFWLPVPVGWAAMNYLQRHDGL